MTRDLPSALRAAVGRDRRCLRRPRTSGVTGSRATPRRASTGAASSSSGGAAASSSASPCTGRSPSCPEQPELVVLSVPAHALEEAVDESLAAGAKALVAIAAGFGELGPEGAARERAIVERVRAAGAVMVGPNCLGIFDAAAELQLAWNDLPGGPIGFVSQSGNIALETGLLLARRRSRLLAARLGREPGRPRRHRARGSARRT